VNPEVLHPGVGIDPDDLAILVAALIKRTGQEAAIVMCFNADGKVCALAVHAMPGHLRGSLASPVIRSP
jgi:hypothetical protein